MYQTNQRTLALLQAQYPDVLFLCEGWPLCLHDRVVVHIAPVDPLLLQPGDFYLQVVPFCHQSARILVCALLREEGLQVELVEETPVPETSYPCIFSREWLEELNRGRHGTPLSSCLLASARGLVRLPWERVFLPDLVDSHPRGRMASAPPPCPPLPRPRFPENSDSAPGRPPTTVQNSIRTSSRPSAFSVETRICPAKHGIAVSLCLVDTRAAASSSSSSREAGPEPRPVGLVAPRACAPKAPKETCTGKISADQQENIKGLTEGEYIDILQATMLFGRTQSARQQQQQREGMKKPTCTLGSHVHTAHTHLPSPQTAPHPQSSAAKPHNNDDNNNHHNAQSFSGDVASLWPNVSAEPGTPVALSPLRHSQSQCVRPDSQCIRTVRFSEQPCTPCARRRTGEKVSRAHELRCRYRDSYQAAIQNPVAFGREVEREGLVVALASVEEDEDFSSACDATRGSGSGCGGQAPWFDPAVQGEVICEESGEKSTAPYWRQEVTNAAPNVCRFSEQTNYQDSWNADVPDQKGSNFSADPQQSHVFPAQVHSSPLTSGEAAPTWDATRETLARRQASTAGDLAAARPAPQRRRDSVPDGRCSSLSTAVVDTSERCELVLVEGRSVRRREGGEPGGAEIPQLHVVKCKNSTAFRLVSPKISRKKVHLPGAEHHGRC